MKKTIYVFVFCIGLLTSHASGQGMVPPYYPIMDTGGATLQQVIDTMYAHADANDTGEGSALDQIKTFPCCP